MPPCWGVLPEVSPSENPGVLSPAHDPSPALVGDHPVSQVCPGPFPETVPSGSSHCKRYSRTGEAEGESRCKPITDLGFLVPLHKHHSSPAAAGSVRSPFPTCPRCSVCLAGNWPAKGLASSRAESAALSPLAGRRVSFSLWIPSHNPTPGSLPEPPGTPGGLPPIAILLSLLAFTGEVGPCLFHAACVLGRLGSYLVLWPKVTFYVVRIKGPDPWLFLHHSPAAPQFPTVCKELV